jgi:archaellum component FlaC
LKRLRDGLESESSSKNEAIELANVRDKEAKEKLTEFKARAKRDKKRITDLKDRVQQLETELKVCGVWHISLQSSLGLNLVGHTNVG